MLMLRDQFFNQYVNPIALEAIAWKFYFVYIVTLAAMIPTIYFLFPGAYPIVSPLCPLC